MARTQLKRSTLAGERLGTGEIPPGSLFVNIPDRQIAVSDALEVGRELIGVRQYSTESSYLTGEHAVRNGALIRATENVSPGAYNSAQWTAAGYSFQEQVTGGLGWDLAFTKTDGLVTQAIYASGTERYRVSLTYTDGLLDSALYEYSSDSGANYSTVGTKTLTYAADGIVDEATWS